MEDHILGDLDDDDGGQMEAVLLENHLFDCKQGFVSRLERV